MARGTTTRMRHGSEATWQGRGWPTRGAGGAWCGHVATGHATIRSTWAPVCGATWKVGSHMEGPQLCPTQFLPFAGDVDAWRALDSIRTAEIKTRVSQEECRPNDWARVLF